MSHFRFSGVSVSAPDTDAPEPTSPAHTHAVRDREILAPFDLEITEARVVVLGPNGSGKSTFLRLLNGLTLPSAGAVTVDGMDTAAQIRDVRRTVGFLFTDPLSQLVMPIVREDVELSLKAGIKNSTARRTAAIEALASLGVDHLSERSVYDLSGGERQLVALVSVLAAGQRVLVADEPNTLLDLRNTLRLRQIFRSLEQQIIFATHDLDFAADAERALVFDGGTIVYDGAAPGGIAAYRALCSIEAPRAEGLDAR